MKYQVLLILLVLSFSKSLSQSLSQERVEWIKSSTVRIIIADGLSSGSGFFIDEKGSIATCWHVIFPSLEKNGKIYIELRNKDTVEMQIEKFFFNNSIGNRNAVGYDFCILCPKRKLDKPTPYMRLGDFNSVNEGQEIFSCGYPLGSQIQFISKGIISTKYLNNNNSIITNKVTMAFPRNEALLDLTLNRGNSGGAIVALGNSSNEDIVIGIADFVVNPLGSLADQIINSSNQSSGLIYTNAILNSSMNVIQGNDMFRNTSILANAMSSMSIGVSGCIPINYLKSALKDMKY
ncbi:serine protease [Chitinophaga sp. CF118]|uniref:S1 family peptidase n=1 Tax=Chitinophaga sp. CF118 TaxID=1884367 RepID=UPI0015A6FA2A|nr:serine protease [Chitinophaga sp. CF118]